MMLKGGYSKSRTSLDSIRCIWKLRQSSVRLLKSPILEKETNTSLLNPSEGTPSDQVKIPSCTVGHGYYSTRLMTVRFKFRWVLYICREATLSLTTLCAWYLVWDCCIIQDEYMSGTTWIVLTTFQSVFILFKANTFTCKIAALKWLILHAV